MKGECLVFDVSLKREDNVVTRTVARKLHAMVICSLVKEFLTLSWILFFAG